MPFTVSWQYGTATPVSVTYGITVTRAKSLTQRFAIRHGLIKEGMTDIQIVEAVINYVMKNIADEAAHTQRQELISAQEATIESTIVADNTLNP